MSGTDYSGPMVCLRKPNAAAALDLSIDSFERHVMPHVRCIRRGSLRLYPLAELQRWADQQATFTLNQEQYR